MTSAGARGRRLAALVVLLALGAAPAERVRGDVQRVTTSARQTVVEHDPEDAPRRGPPAAPVTAELFCALSQAQCAYVADLLRQLVLRHPNRLRVIYRQAVVGFKDAQAVAETMVEAWRQGRFAELEELVAARHGGIRLQELDGLVGRAGLAVEPWRAALAEHRHLPVLERELGVADRLGIVTYPTILWNGVAKLPPPRIDEYEATYDRALAAVRTRFAGAPSETAYRRLVREAASERYRGTQRTIRELGAPRVHVEVGAAPVRGAPEGAAEVTVTMFGDFECPFCRREHGVLRRLEERYHGRLRVVWKHFPLAIHPNARLAAEAAECAHRQGAFWRYHDVLYTTLARLDRAQLLAAAAQAHVDGVRLAADLAAGRCAAAVDADVIQGKALGVEATPTLFVNGVKLTGVRDLPELGVLVEDELAPGWLEDLVPGVPAPAL